MKFGIVWIDLRRVCCITSTSFLPSNKYSTIQAKSVSPNQLELQKRGTIGNNMSTLCREIVVIRCDLLRQLLIQLFNILKPLAIHCLDLFTSSSNFTPSEVILFDLKSQSD